MFEKIRLQKNLKIQQDENQLSVRFFGRVARIARVHQEGLTDKVAKKKDRHITIRPGLYLVLALPTKR
jgi:hypothetical protein